MALGEERQDPGSSHPLRAVAAVLSAFIGIRKSTARDKDLASLKPLHVIVAGLIAAAVFVATIVALVMLITSR
jgi:hypothetical protein